MKDLRSIKGKYYIQRLIEEGEHEHQDFKFAVNDARKIARSLSAFANNDGGRLLIGVKDNGNIAGVRNEEDIYVVEQAADMYCSPPQPLQVDVFTTEGGLKVVRVEIARATRRPVMVREEKGVLKAYYRVNDENIVADNLMVKAWRYKESSVTPSLISLDGAERSFLEMLESGMTDVNTFMRHAHISRTRAEDIVVRLHAMGLVTFTYNNGAFRLIKE